MTQELIIWALLVALIGLIWVLAIAVLSVDRHSQHNQQDAAQPEHPNGYTPHEQTSRHSNTPA